MADVRLDNLAILKLAISVRGPNNELLRVIHHGESCKPFSKLAAPARGNGKGSALDRPSIGPGSLVVATGLDNHGARSWVAGLGVYGKVPGASLVGTVTSALHVLDSPFDGPFSYISDRDSSDCSGRNEGSEQSLGDLHFEGGMALRLSVYGVRWWAQHK